MSTLLTLCIVAKTQFDVSKLIALLCFNLDKSYILIFSTNKPIYCVLHAFSIYLFQCILISAGDRGFTTQGTLDSLIFKDFHAHSMLTN